MGHGYLGILVHTIMLLYSRGSMIYYKGILGTLTCTRVLFSPDDLFILIEGFWRLVVFNEAQRILYMGFFTGVWHLLFGICCTCLWLLLSA